MHSMVHICQGQAYTFYNENRHKTKAKELVKKLARAVRLPRLGNRGLEVAEL